MQGVMYKTAVRILRGSLEVKSGVTQANCWEVNLYHHQGRAMVLAMGEGQLDRKEFSSNCC